MRPGIFCAPILLMITLPWWYQAKAQELSVEITSVEPRERSSFLITYVVQGDSDADYEVDVYLISDADPGFNKRLSALSGDVSGRITGAPRKVTWRAREDFPDAPVGESYRFKLNVHRAGGGGIAWYYIAAPVAVGGIVAAILLSQKDSPPPETNNGVTPTIPLPPTRP
jgi:hypothetical protein